VWRDYPSCLLVNKRFVASGFLKSTMSDNDEKQLKDTELFFGEGDTGIPWAEFDELVRTWGLKKYGSMISEMFWEDTFPDFSQHDMLIPEQRDEWSIHCTMIYDNISETSFRWSESLFNHPRVWTLEGQDAGKTRQFEKYYVFLKKMCRGEARRQVESEGLANMKTMRRHFNIRFGEAQSSVLQARQKAYLAGMPDKIGGVAIPEMCDMVKKLNLFEAERTFFTRNCPIDLRADYKYCQVNVLTQMIIEHLPSLYDSVITNLKNMAKIGKMVGGDPTAGHTSAMDLINQNFCGLGSEVC
jgi:hypothetical protein